LLERADTCASSARRTLTTRYIPRFGKLEGGLKKISFLEPSSSFTTASRTQRAPFRLCRTSLLRGARRVCALFLSVL